MTFYEKIQLKLKYMYTTKTGTPTKTGLSTIPSVIFGMFFLAEAIRTTVVPISGVIRTTVVRISGVIGPTVVRIANATGIGYRHDGSVRFSNKLTHVLNY